MYLRKPYFAKQKKDTFLLQSDTGGNASFKEAGLRELNKIEDGYSQILVNRRSLANKLPRKMGMSNI